jgi:hypothetical protein
MRSIYQLDNWPPTRLAARRLRSRACSVIDHLVLVVGGLVVVVPLGDSIATWHHDAVWIPPQQLVPAAGILLLLSWPWMLGSVAIVYGLRRGHQLRLGPWVRERPAALVLLAALVTLVLVVLIVGFVLGAAKGSLRILPTGGYQVSTVDLNHAEWTTVSRHTYQLWQARFLREDTILALFGAFLVAFGLATRSLRGLLLRSEPPG